MIRFQNGSATELDPVCPVVIWSGKSAKTQPRVDHYLAAKNREAFVHASTEIVDAFSSDPLAMLRENANLLMHMSVETGLPYMTPSLAAIRKMAKDFGGAAKPSGAGGGDCAVALFPDEDARKGFISAISDRGRPVIPVSVAGPAALLG